MSEKPILFNTEMVRAIIDGRKTVTRRIIKPQPEAKLCYAFAGSDGLRGTWAYPDRNAWKSWGDEYRLPLILHDPDRRWTPPCRGDDILWVRERFAVDDEGQYHYYADTNYIEPLSWKPSIHMPREAARIFLRVTNVRCERLQNMTEDDAFLEGYGGCPGAHAELPCWVGGEQCDCGYWYCNHSVQEGFGRDIWDKTLKLKDIPECCWDANPWVWVIEFERVDKP